MRVFALTRPKTRPALLRISSKLSAFFFWGMRLLPVLRTHRDKVQFRWSWATIQVCNGTTKPLHARKTNSWTLLWSHNASWTWLWKRSFNHPFLPRCQNVNSNAAMFLQKTGWARRCFHATKTSRISQDLLSSSLVLLFLRLFLLMFGLHFVGTEFLPFMELQNSYVEKRKCHRSLRWHQGSKPVKFQFEVNYPFRFLFLDTAVLLMKHGSST